MQVNRTWEQYPGWGSFFFFFFFLQKGTAWITYLGTCCILIHHLTIDEHRCEIDLLNQRCTTE